MLIVYDSQDKNPCVTLLRVSDYGVLSPTLIPYVTLYKIHRTFQNGESKEYMSQSWKKYSGNLSFGHDMDFVFMTITAVILIQVCTHPHSIIEFYCTMRR